MTEPRIAPVTDVPPDLGEILGKTLMRDGKPLNIFGTLGRNPEVLKQFNRLAGYLLTRGIIPGREREIVILRVGSNCGSIYEFGQHTLIGRSVGLTDDEILLLTRPAGDGAWSPEDRALVDMADELCATDDVSDATWSALAGRWNEAELVELLVVAGVYRLVSGFLNAARVQLDDGVPGWPQP